MKVIWAQRKPNPYTKFNQATGKVSTVYVYHVEGSKEELAAYKASKGDHYREDAQAGNKPLLFSTSPIPNGCELVKTSKGEFTADDGEYKQFAGLESKYGTTIATEEMAKMKAIVPETK